MKTPFVSLMIAFIIGTTSVSFADTSLGNDSFVSTPSAADVAPLDARVILLAQNLKMDVIVGPTQHAPVFIRMHNSKGQLLAVKKIAKSDQFTLARFDLADLEDGVYQVEITDGTSKKTQEINLKTTTPVPATNRTISME